jgi:hypothetical protein
MSRAGGECAASTNSPGDQNCANKVIRAAELSPDMYPLRPGRRTALNAGGRDSPESCRPLPGHACMDL